MSTKSIKLLEGAVIIRQERKFTEVLREDGLTVFLDKIDDDAADADMLLQLNYVRLHASPEDVMLFVGMIRGLQIAMSYAHRESKNVPNLDRFIDAIPVMRTLISGASQKKRQKRLAAERRTPQKV